MRLKVLTATGILLAAIPNFTAAQEAVPPLQPPYPTAPPPPKWPMMVRPFGLGYDASRQTEDAVAALAVRGFIPVAAPTTLDPLKELVMDCLRRDRQDYTCVQNAVTEIVFEHPATLLPLVFVDGRLEDDTLSWTCIGQARIVTVNFVLQDFFTSNLRARQTSRNRALACIERALGLDRTSEHTDL